MKHSDVQRIFVFVDKNLPQLKNESKSDEFDTVYTFMYNNQVAHIYQTSNMDANYEKMEGCTYNYILFICGKSYTLLKQVPDILKSLKKMVLSKYEKIVLHNINAKSSVYINEHSSPLFENAVIRLSKKGVIEKKDKANYVLCKKFSIILFNYQVQLPLGNYCRDIGMTYSTT